MLLVIQKALSTLISVILMLFPVFGNIANPFAVKEDDCLLNVEIISDVHIDVKEYILQFFLRTGMKQLNKSKSEIDAVVVAGDITNYGDEESLAKFYEIMDECCPVEKLVVAPGNHDIGHAEERGLNHEQARQNLIKYYNAQSGESTDKSYYSTKVDGYTFIVMTDQSNDSWDHPDIYQDQLDFIDAELAKATAEGKPVFIVCHWPVTGTNGQPKVWEDGSLDDANDAVVAVLNKYQNKNVFFISGHMHMGLNQESTDELYGACSVETVDGINYVNLPTYGLVNRYGITWPCTGYQMEVYEDEVVFRARNYALNMWYVLYDRSVPLV